MPSLLNRLMPSKFRTAFMAWFFPGLKFYVDNQLPAVIKNYYEGNPTVFGAVNKIVTKILDVPIIPMKGDVESKIDPLKKLFKDKKQDYSLREFRSHWHLFRLLLGESMVYSESYTAGNNAGEPMSLEIMPVQNIDIETGGAEEPVRYYRVDKNERIALEPKNVHHSRLFLNLDFDDGRQFRGLSPLKVAANIITSMNEGDKLTANSYTTGMPPGILYNKNLDSSEVEEQKIKLEEAWRKKSKDVPVFGGGELGWINLGFSNLKDLQVIQNDARGLRILCNLWGLQEALFSSDKATLDNMKVARRLMYEDRVIPDLNAELEFYNELFASTGITYVANLKNIPALQDDKESLARVFAIGMDRKAITRNEFRENVLNMEEIDDPAMDEEGLIEEATFINPIPGVDIPIDNNDNSNNQR